MITKTLEPTKTITIGGVEKGKLARKVARKYKLTRYARDIMTRPLFRTTKTPKTLDLITLSPKELGFRKCPGVNDIMTAKFCADWSAKHLVGQVIELCPAEVGPHLRLQTCDDFADFPVRWIAMKPIVDSENCPTMFGVGCNELGRWLLANSAKPNIRFELDNRITFRLRKIKMK